MYVDNFRHHYVVFSKLNVFNNIECIQRYSKIPRRRAAINYPTRSSSANHQSLMLITRVVSLLPMRLRSDMWNSEVDFDLAAFQCQARAARGGR